MTERPLLDPLPSRISQLQRDAADPQSSIWVAANAGSGKTRVLTDRVMRLMLAGVPPDQILCLTYTKAAAAEMRQRLSDRLARWTLAEAVALERDLEELMGSAAEPGMADRARTLFVTALETPGGLKIQTIHAFCESILHRFPTEANVPFGFAVVDDFERESMVLQARERVLASGIHGDATLEIPVERLFDMLSDASIGKAIELALAEPSKLRRVLADVPGAKQRLRTMVRIPRGEDSEAISREIVERYPFGAEQHAQLFAVCPAKLGGTRFEDKLAGLNPAGLTAAALLDVYLTKDGMVPKGFPKKAIVEGLPGLWTAFADEAERLAGLNRRLCRARLVERSEALLDVLAAISAEYEGVKRARSLLDFDDLVERMGALLRDKHQSQWVRYKIDGGLTHILVDESQDTNPGQWQVIDALVEEFFEAGGIDRPRTLFAVGDGKQSIYSFQGAEPELFHEWGRKYEWQARAAQRPFSRVQMRTSFRTLAGVLEAVDLVFRDEARREAVLEEMAIVHETARRDPGGAVTLWPPVRQPDDESDTESWPLEAPPDTRNAPRQVAERIAGEVARWIREQRPLAARGRAVQAEDVLILVQSRSNLFHEIIRALHRERLPTPGADRLAVTGHIAVLDLLALGDVLLNPADDLQLAALLRSPLFAVSEDDLHALAHRREGRLWQALQASDLAAPMAAAETLRHWRSRLDFDRPYTFFAQVLQAEGGLRRFHERFGQEVDDIFAEFLDLALAHEQAPQPSLQGFLAAMRQRDVTIKRELSERGGGVRVMTVHGAKGLEAPIVILADAASKPEGRQLSRPVYLHVGTGGPLLVQAGARTDHVPETEWLRDDEAERQQREYWRKLYVAMTRAEDELYVTGALTRQGKLEGSWYEAIDLALRSQSESIPDANGTEVALLYPSQRPLPAPIRSKKSVPVPERAAPLTIASLPPYVAVPVVRPSSAQASVAPERALQTAAEAAFDPETARQRGVAMHALLQHLGRVPPADRAAVSGKALGAILPDRPDLHEELIAAALSILSRPELERFFGPNSRAEVPFLLEAQRNGADILLAGRFDRLVVETDTVWILDFKSDQDVPSDSARVPAAYRTQLALYALAAEQLFPGLAVRAAILWTSLESLLEFPRDVLAGAARGFTLR